MTSCGRRASRVREWRVLRVRDRRGRDRSDDGVHCGALMPEPLEPSIGFLESSFLAAGERPRSLVGDAMATARSLEHLALVPLVSRETRGTPTASSSENRKTNENTTPRENWTQVLVLQEAQRFLMHSILFIEIQERSCRLWRARREGCARPSPRTATPGHGGMQLTTTTPSARSPQAGICAHARMSKGKHAAYL
jgi:hypothetical protein